MFVFQVEVMDILRLMGLFMFTLSLSMLIFQSNQYALKHIKNNIKALIIIFFIILKS